MTKNTEAVETAGTACECSKYDALVNEQLTEDNLANGDYDVFTTGCTQTTKREFAPGHDAKLKSFLIRYSGPEFDVRRNEGGVSSSNDAEGHAKRYEFGYMVVEGIARKAEKDKAKANRPKKAARKLAESAGLVADETTHDGNAARKAREAKSLAEIVQAEEAKHAADQAASRPEPEWDDEPAQPVDLTDEAEVIAKVGRWEYKGIEKDGVFYYLAKDGHTRKEATKYEVLRAV